MGSYKILLFLIVIYDIILALGLSPVLIALKRIE